MACPDAGHNRQKENSLVVEKCQPPEHEGRNTGEEIN